MLSRCPICQGQNHLSPRLDRPGPEGSQGLRRMKTHEAVAEAYGWEAKLCEGSEMAEELDEGKEGWHRDKHNPDEKTD